MGPGDACGGGGGRTEEAEGAAARRAILQTLTVALCLRLEQRIAAVHGDRASVNAGSRTKKLLGLELDCIDTPPSFFTFLLHFASSSGQSIAYLFMLLSPGENKDGSVGND